MCGAAWITCVRRAMKYVGRWSFATSKYRVTGRWSFITSEYFVGGRRSAVALYQGNPDAGGTLIGTQPINVRAGATATANFTWTPAATGQYRLFARVDRDKQVNESDETNNDAWQDVYAGFRGPILIDSGAAGDTAYTSAAGYGYVDSGQADVTSNCGARPEQTLRRDPSGSVAYRFDNLQLERQSARHAHVGRQARRQLLAAPSGHRQRELQRLPDRVEHSSRRELQYLGLRSHSADRRHVHIQAPGAMAQREQRALDQRGQELYRDNQQCLEPGSRDAGRAGWGDPGVGDHERHEPECDRLRR